MPTEDALAGRYRWIRLIGRGAMGEVWLAEDLLLHRQVAIKQLLRQDDESIARVMREARVAARLNHPNIVAVYDLLVLDGRPYVVMEYVQGQSLADEIRRLGRLEPELVARIAGQIADALAVAHRLGVTHRDVKPGNILLSSPDATGVKLADFGIARAATDASVTGTGLMVGTPAYLAPEVAHGAALGPASDVWALGATIYAAVEGHAPYVRGGDENAIAVLTRVATEPVPPPKSAGPLRALLDRMLDRDPAARPTAGQVHRELAWSQVAATAAMPKRPDPATAAGASAATAELHPRPASTAMLPQADRPVRQRRRKRLLAGGVAAAVLIAAGVVLAAWAAGRGSHPTARATTAASTPARTAASSNPTTASAPASTSPSTSASTPHSTAAQDPMNPAAMTQFVQHYYSLIPSDLTTAFTLLGPGLQAQGRAAYTGWWSRFDRVQVTPVGVDAGQHTVTIQLSTHNATSGKVTSDTEVLTLTRTPDGRGLLIDANTVQ